MPVTASPDLLAIDLRTYGENEAAERVLAMSPDQLERVYEQADHYLYSKQYATPSGASPLIAWALAMAAVEVVESRPRQLRWKRRKLKGIHPGH